jgi:hypothetical protein
MALRRRFSPVMPFGKPGSPGYFGCFSFRPMALRHQFSLVLPFSDSQAVMAII